MEYNIKALNSLKFMKFPSVLDLVPENNIELIKEASLLLMFRSASSSLFISRSYVLSL